jgi:alpha-D-ribose 1-methylphosphonate 5-triphosphate synthase subunit PhnG
MNDNVSADDPHPAHPHPVDLHPGRRRWMAVLARADASRLELLLRDHGARPAYAVLRGPEGGLVMVRGKAGGGGASFNLGEMTITRCTVRTETGFIGHAYVAGRDEKRAELAALTDALMQDPDRTVEIERDIIAPLEWEQNARATRRAEKAAATRVQFFAMQTMRT